MKIVFLDFDGVINPFGRGIGHNIPNSGIDFSKTCIGHLNFILNKVKDAKIVVSSSWRMWGLARVKEILKHNSVDESRVIDITGQEKGNRGYQIKCWLDRNTGVDNFVILDDESDMGELLNKLVKTSSFVGLTSKDAEKAVAILNKKE